MQIVQNLILALITAGQFVCVSAQELPSPEVPESKPILTVRALRTTLKALGEERSTKQKELSLASTVEEKQSVSGQLRDLNEKIASLNADLESVVTGIDVESLDERLGVNVEFDEEFRDLLRPIVHELKRATAKPRELEQLRTAEAFHKRRKATAEKALVHLREMIATTKDEEIVLTLRNMEKTWEARLEQYTNELTTASYQLEERINSDESLFGTLRILSCEPEERIFWSLRWR